MKIIKEIIRKIRIRINKIGSKKRNKLLKYNDITIISNNCYAGLTYEYLDLPFLSPTIGLYFFADEYLKFISNLKYYTSCILEQIDAKESKYYTYLKKIHQEDKIIGKLDDVEIVFLHYKNFKDAKTKWDRRCKRINYSKLIIKFNDQNLCSSNQVKKFSNLDYKNKICFTAKNYNFKGNVWLSKYKSQEYVKDDIYTSRKYFNIIDYINDMEVGE